MSDFYDVHAHLAHISSRDKLHDIISNAYIEDVTIINMIDIISDDLNIKNIGEAVRKGFVKLTYGIHPETAMRMDGTNNGFISIGEAISFLEKNSESMVGIGETGLDYTIAKSKKRKYCQENVFREILSFAEEHKKPVTVHARGAFKKSIDILAEYNVTAVLHAFPSNKNQIEECVSNGHYYSIAPIAIKNGRFGNVVKSAPLENLVTESDTPQLGNFGTGKPRDVIGVANFISATKGICMNDVYETLAKNARKIFSID